MLHEFFMPHGMCFRWQADLLALHSISDAVITLSYLSIPLALVYFVRHRKDFKFGWVLLLFAGFIVACGLTHAMGIWVLWNPDYYAQGAVKLVTALLSIGTALAVWPLLPKLLALPSPSDLQAANDALANEIEERRRAQSRVEELNASLEGTVAMRTAELARSNADLESFAYIASHDLKAPLRAINSLSVWIEEDLSEQVSGQTADYLSTMRGRVKRMQQMLDDLLEYSKLSRSSDDDEAPVNAADLITDVLQIASVPAGFEVVRRGVPEQVEAPRMPLQQILLNFISNAVKHHDRTTGRIEIDVAVERDGTVRFSVADDGPGVPEEYRERIFEMFQTLRPRDEVEGSGIGLALVKKYVNLYRGRVDVADNGARGAVFYLWWPPAQSLVPAGPGDADDSSSSAAG